MVSKTGRPVSQEPARQERRLVCSLQTKTIPGSLPDYEAGSVYQARGRSADTARFRHRDRCIAVRDRIRPQRLGPAGARAAIPVVWIFCRAGRIVARRDLAGYAPRCQTQDPGVQIIVSAFAAG